MAGSDTTRAHAGNVSVRSTVSHRVGPSQINRSRTVNPSNDRKVIRLSYIRRRH
jgi:hypothetical protein